jgi:phosphoribosyl-AMP cyclohydrolase
MTTFNDAETTTQQALHFAARTSVEQVEEGHDLAPKFDRDGLIACVTTDAVTGDVLMLGYMNREALEKTILTGEAHYWSRSRQVLWRKGATSGLMQSVVEMRIDDDQDALWLRVSLSAGTHSSPASCHVGYRSCFYRAIELKTGKISYAEREKTFDPHLVYGDAPNPTIL